MPPQAAVGTFPTVSSEVYTSSGMVRLWRMTFQMRDDSSLSKKSFVLSGQSKAKALTEGSNITIRFCVAFVLKMFKRFHNN
jgi:hypothetical protein